MLSVSKFKLIQPTCGPVRRRWTNLLSEYRSHFPQHVEVADVVQIAGRRHDPQQSFGADRFRDSDGDQSYAVLAASDGVLDRQRGVDGGHVVFAVRDNNCQVAGERTSTATVCVDFRPRPIQCVVQVRPSAAVRHMPDGMKKSRLLLVPAERDHNLGAVTEPYDGNLRGVGTDLKLAGYIDDKLAQHIPSRIIRKIYATRRINNKCQIHVTLG